MKGFTSLPGVLYVTIFIICLVQCKKEQNFPAAQPEISYGKPGCATSALVSWFAGSGTAGFYNTTINHAQMRPRALVTDAAGNVYFTDYGYHAIRKITMAGTVVTLAGSTTAGYVNGSGTSAKDLHTKEALKG